MPSVTFLSFVTLYKKHSTLVKNNFRNFCHCIPVKILSGNGFAPLYLETALVKIKEENKKYGQQEKSLKEEFIPIRPVACDKKNPCVSRQQIGNGLGIEIK